MAATHPARATPRVPETRPRLDLSGPKLASAFKALAAAAEEMGGIERYVDALKLKSALFAETFGAGRMRTVELGAFRNACAWMSTVRRRIGPYIEPETFERTRAAMARLLEGCADTTATDERIAVFRGAFPDDRNHRWAHDLAAELLHHVDPERYPLMSRWVWDERVNTGVLREIWFGEDLDHARLEVPARYETFVVLREELAQFLAGHGVYRDTLFFVDLLCAQVYADYLNEQGGTYLRADFANAPQPMMHVTRLLGLDGVTESGRTRVKAADGTAILVEDPPRLA